MSKIEHGTRGMPTQLRMIADDVYGADGALTAEHDVLAQAEQDYRDRRRALVLSEEIAEAARALMQPWQHTPTVTTLDTHLHARGLLPPTT